MEKGKVFLIKDLEEYNLFCKWYGNISNENIIRYLKRGIRVFIYLDKNGLYNGWNNANLGKFNPNVLCDLNVEIRKKKLEILNKI